MALTGDTTITSGIKFDQSIYIDAFGNVMREENGDMQYKMVEGAVQIVNGTIEEVLHLIGHEKEIIKELMDTDGVLRTTPDVNEKVKAFPTPPPGAFIIEEKGRLFGAIIDRNGEHQLIGIVSNVIPYKHNGVHYKAMMYQRSKEWSFCNPKDIRPFDLIQNGGHIGIVSIRGFLWFQVNKGINGELSKLNLILENGYFFIEKSDDVIEWTRLRQCLRIGEFASNVTELESKDCIVTRHGGIVMTDKGLELFGRGNAIVSYPSLQDMRKAMLVPGPVPDETEEGNGFIGREIVRNDDSSIEFRRFESNFNAESAAHISTSDLEEGIENMNINADETPFLEDYDVESDENVE